MLAVGEHGRMADNNVFENDRPPEDNIVPKTQIVVDGNISPKRLRALVQLQLEEEHLDYKESFDLSNRAAKKRAKVDLVCDLVAMANTGGGYVVIGVKEHNNGTFTVEGVDEACVSFLKQESVQNWVDSYVDRTLKLRVRAIKWNEDKTVVLICVFPTVLPAVFKKDGQYQDSKTGRGITKFQTAELFVRHGSKTERASYEDWCRIAENIREDERGKLVNAQSQHQDILDRLDIMIALVGGAPPCRRTLDLASGSAGDIEDRVAQLMSLQNPVAFRRVIRNEFNSIRTFLSDQQTVESREELQECLDRDFVTFVRRVFPIWVAAIEYNGEELASTLADQLHKLYCRSHSLRFKAPQEQCRPLWLQSKILFTVYVCGAFAVMRDKPVYARWFLDRGNPFDSYWRSRSWFRYVLTMLARAKLLEKKGLCVEAVEFAKSDTYVVSQFEDEDDLIGGICRFDFLQCVTTLLRMKDVHETYPSFAAYQKAKIVPIVEAIIESASQDLWIPQVAPAPLAEAIDELDKIAGKEFGFYYGWDYGEWDSTVVSDFLHKHRGTGSG